MSAPLAPTWLTVDGYVHDIVSPLSLTWAFNDEGDSQTAYALERSKNGGALQYFNVETSEWGAVEVKNLRTSNTALILAGFDGFSVGIETDTIVFRVKTWDTEDLPSPYSAGLTVTGKHAVAKIVSPIGSAAVAGPAVTVTWTARQMASLRFRLLDEGDRGGGFGQEPFGSMLFGQGTLGPGAVLVDTGKVPYTDEFGDGDYGTFTPERFLTPGFSYTAEVRLWSDYDVEGPIDAVTFSVAPVAPPVEPGPVSQWLLELHDQGLAWAVSTWDRIEVSMKLGKPATLQMTLPGGSGVESHLGERRSDLILLRDRQRWLRVRVLTVNDDLDDRAHTVTLGCVDYAGILQHRFLQPPDLLDTAVLENNDWASAWEPTTHWREGTMVIDPAEPPDFQQFEALQDVPAERASDWSFTRSYDQNRLVVFGGKLWKATIDHEASGSPWSKSRSYALGDRVEHNGRVYRGRWVNNKARPPGASGAWVRISIAPFQPGQAAGWVNVTPARPGLDAVNWVNVPNDRYRARRYVIENDPDDSMPVPAGRVGLSQEDIAWDLIEMTQAKLNGGLGITRATGDNLGRQRDRTFPHVSRTIFELIDDVGSATDGFEWWIDADLRWHSQTPVRWRDLRGTMVFDFGTTVLKVGRVSGNDFYSSAVHAGDDETTPEFVEVESPVRGRWETYLSNRDIVKQSTLRERADTALDRAAQIVPFYRLTLTPGVLRGSNLQLGDVVPLRIDSPPRLDVISLVRVVEIELTITGDGDEQVRVGVETVGEGLGDEPDLNAVGNPFGSPQRVDQIRELGDLLARFDGKLR